jgi:hypothetical protein
VRAFEVASVDDQPGRAVVGPHFPENDFRELASKKFMSWGREKQNAVSKYPVAVSNQSQRAA